MFPNDQSGRALITRTVLAERLRSAGLRSSDVVCAHVGMKRLGYVCGAAQTVIDALLDAVGPTGTVMMPTFSGEHSDPATWRFPPVPPAWIKPIRDETPPYDPHLTPTRQMGKVAELFRHRPGALRSDHPHSSFAALGPRARGLVLNHCLGFRFGPQSPLGRLAAMDGKVLLLGADDNRATFVYLAQYCAGLGEIVAKSVPMQDSGQTVWTDHADFALNNALVDAGVKHLLNTGLAKTTPIGQGRALVFDARPGLVELVNWFSYQQSRLVRTPTPVPSDWSEWLPVQPTGD